MNNENAPERAWIHNHSLDQRCPMFFCYDGKLSGKECAEYIRADLVDQIPGRCGECAYWDRFDDSESVGNCLLEADKCAWGAGDFCSAFKPKDSSK